MVKRKQKPDVKLEVRLQDFNKRHPDITDIKKIMAGMKHYYPKTYPKRYVFDEREVSQKIKELNLFNSVAAKL